MPGAIAIRATRAAVATSVATAALAATSFTSSALAATLATSRAAAHVRPAHGGRDESEESQRRARGRTLQSRCDTHP